MIANTRVTNFFSFYCTAYSYAHDLGDEILEMKSSGPSQPWLLCEECYNTPDILLIVKGHSLDSTKHKRIGKMRAHDFCWGCLSDVRYTPILGTYLGYFVHSASDMKMGHILILSIHRVYPTTMQLRGWLSIIPYYLVQLEMALEESNKVWLNKRVRVSPDRKFFPLKK